MATEAVPAAPAPVKTFDRERERRLFKRYARFDDQEARAELVERFLPVAYKMARRYQRPGEPIDDLAQVAAMGLLKALDRFDPERGLEFISYAAPTIMGELKRYFRDYGWVMHLSRSDQELAASVKRGSEEAARRLGRAPTPREIAAQARLSVEEVLRGLDSAGAAQPASLDGASGATDESPGFERWLARREDGFDLVENRDAISRGMRALTKREQRVLYMRFYEDFTQSEIAEEIGVSQMQVSRIIRQALERSRLAEELPAS
jgi:RNA polymerase sigma-B factor